MKKLQEARAEVEEEVEGQLASNNNNDTGTESATLHELYLSSIFSLCRGNQKRMLSKLKDAEVANRGRLVAELVHIGQDFLGTGAAAKSELAMLVKTDSGVHSRSEADAVEQF